MGEGREAWAHGRGAGTMRLGGHVALARFPPPLRASVSGGMQHARKLRSVPSVTCRNVVTNSMCTYVFPARSAQSYDPYVFFSFSSFLPERTILHDSALFCKRYKIVAGRAPLFCNLTK